MTGSDDDVLRLTAVIERQRRILDQIRASAAGESVVAMARGALMERLGLSSAEAASQLAELSAATGIPIAEMAAAVLSPDTSARGDGLHLAVPADSDGLDAAGPGPSGPGSLMVQAAAELAADGADLVGTVAGPVLGPLGASAVVLWLLDADGALTLLGEAGLGQGEVSRWRHLPPQLDCPAQRVARGSADLWWPAGRPEGDAAPVPGPADGARAVLALRERGGQLLGVMEVSWPEPLAAFGTEVRQELSALAAGCAPVIAARLAHASLAAAHPRAAVYTLLDGLADSVLVVQAIRDDSGQVTDFGIEHVSPRFRDLAGRTGNDLARLTLLEAYPASVSGQGLFARAMQVLTDGAPQHVPGPLSEALASGFPARPAPGEAAPPPLAGLRVARFFDGAIFTWHDDDAAGRAPDLAVLLDHAQRLGRLGGWEENLVTGLVRWTDSAFELFGLVPRSGDGDPAGRSAQLRNGGRQAGRDALPAAPGRAAGGGDRRRSASCTPMTGASARSGSSPNRSWTRPTRWSRCAGPSRTSRRTTTRRSPWPRRATSWPTASSGSPRSTCSRCACSGPSCHPTRCRWKRPGSTSRYATGPAGQGHLVGGDWYDTLLLPTNDVLLVVGDVAGHGIDAVTGMVAARNSLRGLAITGAGPAELLGMLNGVVCHLTSGVVGTVVCGLYNPETRVLRWARAGHLPPVLVRGGTARELPLPGGVLLGMDPDASYEEAVQSLEPGDTLLLFTDGLIERRGDSIEDVLAEFVAGLGPGAAGRPEAGDLTAAAQADQILASAVSDTGDDACLVAVRIR